MKFDFQSSNPNRQNNSVTIIISCPKKKKQGVITKINRDNEPVRQKPAFSLTALIKYSYFYQT
jgi:hypothetical protein